MARWGEGDPRWIVEDRPDGANVNNWHWSEKNATGWSKNRLKALLEGLKFDQGSTAVELTTVKKVEGEATANNRKAKLIFLFEWVLEVNFKAHVAGSDTEYLGLVEIPNLSDENEASEVDVNVTVSTRGPLEAQVRAAVAGPGQEKIREALGVYIRELKEEFSKGLILPTDKPKPQVITKSKTTTAAPSAAPSTGIDKRAFQNAVVISEKEDTLPDRSSETFEVQEISTSETFKVPPERLFEVLADPKLVKRWANCEVKWNFKPDGYFELFGGMVHGTFLRIDDNKQIEMKWRLKSFPAGHFAQVRFTLKDKSDSTDLEVTAANVPKHKAEETENGFQRYYLQAISRTFGFGARIF